MLVIVCLLTAVRWRSNLRQDVLVLSRGDQPFVVYSLNDAFYLRHRVKFTFGEVWSEKTGEYYLDESARYREDNLFSFTYRVIHAVAALAYTWLAISAIRESRRYHNQTSSNQGQWNHDPKVREPE